MNRIVQIALYTLLGLGVVGIGLGAIDYYVYSLTGMFMRKFNLCNYKSMSVRTENGAEQLLSFEINPRQIAEIMSEKEEYEVKLNSGSLTIISRKYNGVRYNIEFQTSSGRPEFTVNTYRWREDPGPLGEECSAPSAVVWQRIYQMVDDLPFDDSQKNEIKKCIRVGPHSIGPPW